MTRKEFRKQNKKSSKANPLEVAGAVASIISAVIELLNYFHIRPQNLTNGSRKTPISYTLI